MRGANRTGLPFTGDASGDLLFKTLSKFNLLTRPYQPGGQDQADLKNVMITNAVRCVPPQNKPTGAEINNCRAFLTGRLATLPKLKAVIILGRVAHISTLRALGLKLKDAPFSHGATAHTEIENGPILLISSYHCSRYNVNTRRLTEEMFDAVFTTATEHLAS